MDDKKGLGKVLAIVGLGVVLVALAAFLKARSGGLTGSALSPDAAVRRAGILRKSYYKTPQMRAFTYFVKTPNQQDLRTYCEDYRGKYGVGMSLRIYFFDNEEETPDISDEHKLPVESKRYLIAEYASEPTTSGELKFHKDLSETP